MKQCYFSLNLVFVLDYTVIFCKTRLFMLIGDGFTIVIFKWINAHFYNFPVLMFIMINIDKCILHKQKFFGIPFRMWMCPETRKVEICYYRQQILWEFRGSICYNCFSQVFCGERLFGLRSVQFSLNARLKLALRWPLNANLSLLLFIRFIGSTTYPTGALEALHSRMMLRGRCILPDESGMPGMLWFWPYCYCCAHSVHLETFSDLVSVHGSAV